MEWLLGRHSKNMKSEIRSKRSGLPDEARVHFITFANTGYMPPDRLVTEANRFGFDTIRAMNEHDIPEFVEKHKEFIDSNSHGYGLWIWKPKIILDTLKSIAPCDILIYCDAGMHLNVKGLTRYYQYLQRLNTPAVDMITFSTNDKYWAQQYCKADVAHHYYPEFLDRTDHYCYAGVMMLKNTSNTIRVISEWLELCENYHFIDGTSSQLYAERPDFAGQDCDNGLFNICLIKNGINAYIYPDETNIYDKYGNQAHMVSNDWSSLDKFPFQCRRIRPR